MMKLLYTLSFLAVFNLACLGSQNRKVLFIGIDGTRSDALQQANTPHIDALISGSLYSYDSWHTGITWSGPSWASILTGVNFNKHGITDNSFTGSNFNAYPAFPKRAKEIYPGIKAVEVVEWDPLADDFYNDGWDRKVKVTDGSTFPTADSAVIELQDTGLDALFVYFDKVDLTGHLTTFTPGNSLYISAIQDVDSAIGRVLNALYARPAYASENWLIIVVTDHGGINFGHGGNSNEERHIWWIASGSVVPNQQITKADPGTYNCHLDNVYDSTCVNLPLLKESPVHTDAAVTALHHLIWDAGINPETRSDWNLDGKSWLLMPNAVEEIATAQISLYPNPGTGNFTISGAEAFTYAAVYDLTGRQVLAFNNTADLPKLQLNLEGTAAGTYIVRLTGNNTTVSLPLVIAQP